MSTFTWWGREALPCMHALTYTAAVARRSSPQDLGLGPLETEIMRVLWRRGPSLGVDIAKSVNRRRREPLAYTTIINVLSNLEGKEVVDHVTEGRAYRFAPTLTEAELRQRQARSRARALLDAFTDEAVSAIVGELRSDPALEERFRRLLDDDEAHRQ